MPAEQPPANQQQQQRQPENEVLAWFKSVPIITRTLFSSVIALALTSAFGLIHPRYLILIGPAVYREWQIWRIVTSCLFMPLGTSFLFQLYFLYNYSRGLETSYFQGRTADMAWFVFMVMIMLNAFGIMFRFPLLTHGLVMSLTYLWSQANRDSIVSFFFGLRFKAMYLPLVILAYDFLSNSFSIATVAGMFAAHVYWYFEEVYPRIPNSNGRRFLKAPEFLYTYFPRDEAAQGGFSPDGSSTTYAAREQPGELRQRSAWGRGYRLGSG